MGHLLLGGTLFLTGELTGARDHLEQAISRYEQPAAPPRQQVLYVQDQKSTGLCYLALTLTLLGQPDSGMRAAEHGLAHSQSLGGPHTVNFSLCYLAAVCHIQRRSRQALERATRSLAFAREQGFATWIGVSQVVRGASLVRNGEPEAGCEEIAQGMNAHRAMEAIAYQPFCLSLYAEGLVACGRPDEALEALARGIALSAETGERFYLAEMWRQKGEILAGTGNPAEAKQWLRKAIELSGQQQARLFELRSAVTLCRLLDGQERSRVLREVLEPAYRAFKEGFDTADAVDAKASLGSAAPH
jgi:tetratricopeptide (TPR) repeat protein